MKNIIKYIAVSVCAVVSSCSYLDKQPDDMKTDEMVWSSKTEVIKYLTNCYASLPMDNLHNADPWLGCADECDIVWSVYPTYGINQGNWEPSTSFYVKWGTYYKAIRATFEFENNIGRCGQLSDELKNRYSGEAKFLRAYYYFLLLRQYGPVVLFKKQPSLNDDYANMSRTPWDECVEYVCTLLDDAASTLPVSWEAEPGSYGRANKLTCYAVKSQMRLLAASEQWNGNPAYLDFANKDGKKLAPQAYDENKWELAAAAAAQMIALAEANPTACGLYTANQELTDANYNPYKSYYDIFNSGWNKEVIFGSIDNGHSSYQDNSEARYAWVIHCNPVNAKSSAGMGGVGPTLRLVDAFYMENGYGIEDAASGYVESGFATADSPHITVSATAQGTEAGRVKLINDLMNLDAWGHTKGDRNMFANREPRFYASINYQHRIPLTVSDDAAMRNGWSSAKNKDGYGRLECYYGGISNSKTNNYSYSTTGFYPQKRIIPCDFTTSNILPGKYISIYLRYAEILLNYIEALNEYDPNNSDIRKYWDMIHRRAGIPSIFETHPEITGDKELQRKYILRERQIELNLEGDRFFTCHRRLLCGEPDKGQTVDDRIYGDGGRIWGLTTFNHDGYSAGDPDTNGFTSEEFYVRTPIESRVWKDNYYLFPIPQSEINKSPGLVQNPGW